MDLAEKLERLYLFCIVHELEFFAGANGGVVIQSGNDEVCVGALGPDGWTYTGNFPEVDAWTRSVFSESQVPRKGAN